MRIAFFAWESLHSIPVGGVAVHVTELAAALERRRHEVHVFTRLGAWQPTYDLIDGVHYHRCPIELDRDFVTEMNNMCNRFAYFLGETEAYQGGKFDIVHAHDWLCAKGIVQVKNDRGRSTVYTLHSTEFGRCGNNNFDGRSGRIRAFEAEGAYCADRVITVSAALADEVKWLYNVPDWKLRVVHNGINCTRFDGTIDPAMCRSRYGIGPLDPMVLYVGRMSTQKGPDLLLEAIPGILAYRPDAKFVFVGDGDMKPYLEHRAWELNVGHAVRFLGSMPADEWLNDLFKSSDVVCVPSRNEPFGMVVLEAWAAGKPVVVTENGGPRTFATHGLDGYVVHPTPDSICWGIKSIFSNFAHARWMGERGRVKAAYGFSWDMIAKQTEGIYREIC
ncbi:MAG: glycosyltransferase family 4 protein [Deltaproteobacteria bacterium]|nr:glycosyltransferase family 4 protein [Deltaproteobacteria bacterium]